MDAEKTEEKVVRRSEIYYNSNLLDEEKKTSPVLYQLEKNEDKPLERETLKKIPGVELPFNDVDPDDGYVPTYKKEDIPEFTGELVTEEEQRAKGLFRKCDRIKAAQQLQKKFPDLFFAPNILRVESPHKTSEEGRTEEEVDTFEENKRYLEQLEKEHQTYRIEIDSCRYVGKLFNTYLLYERKDEVLLIDQHAAHERLIFDKLREQMENKAVSSQAMLLPYELQLNAFEATFIEERIEDIRAMGFTIERAQNNTFLISAVPLLLQGMKVDTFFNEILGDVSGFRSIKLTELLRDKLAMAACKAAVKGGMDITQAEIDKLFEMMNGNMGLKCPHGRPVVTKITKTELEKMFKRKL